MAKSKKKAQSARVGKLFQVVGWMSDDKKKMLVAAIEQHQFINGQSDFINLAADAIIAQSKKGKPAIAQPLCFLTVDQREVLAALKLAAKE